MATQGSHTPLWDWGQDHTGLLHTFVGLGPRPRRALTPLCGTGVEAFKIGKITDILTKL